MTNLSAGLVAADSSIHGVVRYCIVMLLLVDEVAQCMSVDVSRSPI